MINKFSDDWAAVERWAQEQEARYTKSLIAKNDDETRGRIKQLHELLCLPDQDDSAPVVTRVEID